MTDMEKLIEEAKSGLAAFDLYWGDGGPVDAAYGRPWELIRGLLAVFEKALTPTDGEREALVEAISDLGQWIVRLVAEVRRLRTDEAEDERIDAWHYVADHEAFKSCYDEEQPLIDSVLARITQLHELESTVNELAPAPEPQAEPSSEAPEPSGEPTERTSNFGWAIWHLTKAKAATSIAEAQMHAVAASARAQLQVVAEMGATRGVDPNGPTTWQEDWS